MAPREWTGHRATMTGTATAGHPVAQGQETRLATKGGIVGGALPTNCDHADQGIRVRARVPVTSRRLAAEDRADLVHAITSPVPDGHVIRADAALRMTRR